MSNPLSPEALEQMKALEAAKPISVGTPNYIVELPHRFGRYFGPHGDGYQTGSISLYGEWAREESLLLESMIEPGNWVLDVGAHCGSLTMAFASRVTQTGRVFAFEPQHYPSMCLTANVITNSLAHFVSPMKLAIGKEDGEIKVPILDVRNVGNFGGCSLVEDCTGPSEIVPMLAIDSLNLPACHLIKVDVEGMEPDVLEGAYQTIAKHRPILWVEQLDHREGSREDLLRIFAEHDYKAWKIATWISSPRNIRNCRVNPFRTPDGQPMIDINILAVPRTSTPPAFVEKRDWNGGIEEFK